MEYGNKTRSYQPTGLGETQGIHDMRWATKSLAAAALPVSTEFFTGAPSTDPTVDRFYQYGLCDSGNDFTIVGIAVQLIGQNTGALADMAQIIEYCSVRFTTNQREQMTLPVLMLPQGGGLSIMSGQVAITAANSPGGTGILGATNGVPDRRAMFRLASPLTIQSGQGFKAELLAPSAGSTFGTKTLGQIVLCRIILDGILKRLKG